MRRGAVARAPVFGHPATSSKEPREGGVDRRQAAFTSIFFSSGFSTASLGTVTVRTPSA